MCMSPMWRMCSGCSGLKPGNCRLCRVILIVCGSIQKPYSTKIVPKSWIIIVSGSEKGIKKITPRISARMSTGGFGGPNDFPRMGSKANDNQSSPRNTRSKNDRFNDPRENSHARIKRRVKKNKSGIFSIFSNECRTRSNGLPESPGKYFLWEGSRFLSKSSHDV